MTYPFLESQEQSHTVTWLCCSQREGEEESGEQGRKEAGKKRKGEKGKKERKRKRKRKEGRHVGREGEGRGGTGGGGEGRGGGQEGRGPGRAQRLSSPSLPDEYFLPTGTANPELLGAEVHEAAHLSLVSPSCWALPPGRNSWLLPGAVWLPCLVLSGQDPVQVTRTIVGEREAGRCGKREECGGEMDLATHQLGALAGVPACPMLSLLLSARTAWGSPASWAAGSPQRNQHTTEASGVAPLKYPRTLRGLCTPFPPEASPHVRTPVHQEGDKHSQQRAALAPLRVSGQNVPPPAGHPCEPAFLWPLSFVRSLNMLGGYSTKSPASFGLKGTRQQLLKQFTCRLSARWMSAQFLVCAGHHSMNFTHTLSPLMPTATLKWAPLVGPGNEGPETPRAA